jgi:hypothetical protein
MSSVSRMGPSTEGGLNDLNRHVGGSLRPDVLWKKWNLWLGNLLAWFEFDRHQGCSCL